MIRFVAAAAGACACAYIVGVRVDDTFPGALAGCLALVLLGWLGDVREARPEQPREVSQTAHFLILTLPLGAWIILDDVLTEGVAAALITAAVATYAWFRLQTTVTLRAR